jgi:hypothetical protein
MFLKNLNSYEKIFLITPISALLVIVLSLATKVLPPFAALAVLVNILITVALLGYLITFSLGYRYNTVLRFRKKPAVETSKREKRLYDFCGLSLVILFFLVVALSTL